MSEYLEKAKELRAIETPHYNCAHSVLIPFAEKAGLDGETAYRLAACFGGGMKRGSVCGAVTGGLMALGLLGLDDPATTAEFHRIFGERHGGMLDCSKLLAASAAAGEPKKQHCDGLVFESVRLVEELLEKHSKTVRD